MSERDLKARPTVTHFLQRATTPNSSSPYEIVEASYTQTTSGLYSETLQLLGIMLHTYNPTDQKALAEALVQV